MDVVMELSECFDILGVQPGAHLKEVRSAFRRLALTCHPDLAGPQGAKKFEAAAAAYARLKSATPAQISESLKKKKSRGAFAGSPFARGGKEARMSREGRRAAKEDDRSQRVRDLMLERALVETELTLARIVEKAARTGDSREPVSVAQRLASSHPGVRLLAMGALARSKPDRETFASLVGMLRRWPPDDDIMEHLTLIDCTAEQKLEIIAALEPRVHLLSEASAFSLMRWGSSSRADESLNERMLSHPSPRVIARALARWRRREPPDDLTLIRLLKREEEEEVLVPLLRLLKERSIPAFACARVRLLSENHASAAVRVWAGSIVRAKNLV